jgi:hypothetical protein
MTIDPEGVRETAVPGVSYGLLWFHAHWLAMPSSPTEVLICSPPN